MSSIKKPRLWLCAAAAAAAFWVTFRVLEAVAAPMPATAPIAFAPAPGDEVEDAALSAMIHRLAAEARHSVR